MSNSFASTNMITNMPAPDHLDRLLCHLQCFSAKTNERKIEATPNKTQCPVFKRLQRNIGEWILAVLLVWTNILKNMSVNPEDWDADITFPDFNLALLERERSWCRNWIVTFPWKEIWSVFENFNADHGWRREWTGRNSRGFPKNINE